MRKYSALTIVISSAVLVSATNLAAGRESGGILFGHWGNNTSSPQRQLDGKIQSQVIEKKNLAFVPLAKASTSVDVNSLTAPSEDEETAFLETRSTQPTFATAIGPVLKEPEQEGGVGVYTVQEGDTLSSIALENKITMNTILWSNEIDNIDSIRPGDKIFILPISGLNYTVGASDTIESIAKKYKAEPQQIIAFNELPANGELKKGQEIIIPGGEKELPPSVQPSSDSLIARRQYATPTGGVPEVSGGKKLEGKAGTGHKFPYGYCTWYVSQRRYVPWSGNAGAWLYNAKSMGYATGRKPAAGAIVVTTDSAYYGHVALVEKVSGGSITVSEMNFKGWGVTNRRVIPINSRTIRGYIY